MVASGSAEGVLITGVYGSGKSSVAAEIGYQLEQRGELYALLDLDFLGWVGDHDTGRATMLRNLAAVAPSYRDLGVARYVLAYFVPDRGTLEQIKDALGIRLRVVRLSVPVAEVERRLSADVTSARKDDLRDAAEAVAASAGAGLENLLIDGTGPVQDIASQVMCWLGWH
jgi:adenylylsulfate kinase-like enzyme